MSRAIKTAKAHATISITNTTTVTNIVTTSANLNTLKVLPGMPILFTQSMGNIIAGTNYWVLKILSGW